AAPRARPRRATSNVFAMFDQSQIQEFKEAFNMIDQNRDGFIDKEDLHDMLASMGKNPTDEYLEGMMSEAPGPINFTMFLTMFGEKLNGTDPEDVIRNAFSGMDSGTRCCSSWECHSSAWGCQSCCPKQLPNLLGLSCPFTAGASLWWHRGTSTLRQQSRTNLLLDTEVFMGRVNKLTPLAQVSQSSCGCPTPGSVQGQAGQGLEHPGIGKVLAGGGMRWALTSSPTQTILGFDESVKLQNCLGSREPRGAQPGQGQGPAPGQPQHSTGWEWLRGEQPWDKDLGVLLVTNWM
uniref:Myosin light chain 9 n=1 Tax=Junco hyemalis TaxID=40217 RepID=A0A8C5NKV0_JUNHY